MAKGFTGNNCLNYKNHITGKVNGIAYSIQGNILLGQQILDSMEARFRNASGDLACRLMAALQGAKVVGADTRCSTYGTSSLFAFVKVSQPADPFGSPSFKLGVISNGSSGEPIDSLQKLFNTAHHCSGAGISHSELEYVVRITPNPATEQLTITMAHTGQASINLYNMLGQLQVSILSKDTKEVISTTHLPRGIYIVEINGDIRYRTRVLLQ